MDPSAGAGILRDVQVVSSLGVYPMALCTAETIQNGSACLRIAPPGLPPDEGFAALRPHLLSGHWGAKLGLCAVQPGLMGALARTIHEAAPLARIWDPVLGPSSGAGLHDRETLLALAEALLPSGGWVVSPNLPEARTLLGGPTSDPAALARPWLELGAEAVWLKGGHGEGGDIQDLWITAGSVLSLGAHPRLPGELRGTGCAVASAWLALRLRGADAVRAASEAGAWLRRHWERAAAPGGYGRPALLPECP